MTGQKNELIITRIFDAPRKLAWKAWTEAEQVMRWWGSKIFMSPSCKIDFRVGGKYLFCMRSDSGPEAWQKGIWSTGVYKEIMPMEKIVFTDCFADEKGNVVPSTHYGMDGIPLEMEVTLTFEEVEGGKTKMTLLHMGMPEKFKKECQTGWNESFDKLDKVLTGVPQGYHTITPHLVVRGAREAIEFYKKIFGAEVSFIQERPDGKVMHSEIKIGDSFLMIADECPAHQGHETDCVRSPVDLGGTTANLYLYVNDVGAVFNKAVKNGATALMPVTDMFWGDRNRDAERSFWAFLGGGDAQRGCQPRTAKARRGEILQPAEIAQVLK